MFTYKFFYSIMNSQYLIGIAGNIRIYICSYGFFNLFHFIRRSQKDQTCAPVNLFYLNREMINNLKIFLSILKAQNGDFTKIMFFFLYKMIYKIIHIMKNHNNIS